MLFETRHLILWKYKFIDGWIQPDPFTAAVELPAQTPSCSMNRLKVSLLAADPKLIQERECCFLCFPWHSAKHECAGLFPVLPLAVVQGCFLCFPWRSAKHECCFLCFPWQSAKHECCFLCFPWRSAKHKCVGCHGHFSAPTDNKGIVSVAWGSETGNCVYYI